MKKASADAMLIDGIAEHLMRAFPVFPKKLLKSDALQRAHSMPSSQIQILLLLRDGACSVGDLSRYLGIAKPNVTPLINSLLAAGLVERVRDNADRRVVKVHLLPAGESKIAALHTSFQHYAAAWADKLSRSEAKELSNALGTLIRVMANVSDEQA